MQLQCKSCTCVYSSRAVLCYVLGIKHSSIANSKSSHKYALILLKWHLFLMPTCKNQLLLTRMFQSSVSTISWSTTAVVAATTPSTSVWQSEGQFHVHLCLQQRCIVLLLFRSPLGVCIKVYVCLPLMVPTSLPPCLLFSPFTYTVSLPQPNLTALPLTHSLALSHSSTAPSLQARSSRSARTIPYCSPPYVHLPHSPPLTQARSATRRML